MNFAVIFAGGVGQRMNTASLPKQFLKVHDKEIIVHTIEHFQNNDNIDGIVVVCVENYIDLMQSLKQKYSLSKVLEIVAGGRLGQESIYNGLQTVKKYIRSDNDIVLIHDGVRPLIDSATIDKNIECVKAHGACVTVAKSIETILTIGDSGNIDELLDRSKCYLGRAPQSFYFKDIYDCHLKANEMGKHDFIDSATLSQYFGHKIYVVEGPTYNIKVTTPLDFYMFKAILDSSEYEQIRIL